MLLPGVALKSNCGPRREEEFTEPSHGRDRLVPRGS
jgi:hypothetical protein